MSLDNIAQDRAKPYIYIHRHCHLCKVTSVLWLQDETALQRQGLINTLIMAPCTHAKLEETIYPVFNIKEDFDSKVETGAIRITQTCLHEN